MSGEKSSKIGSSFVIGATCITGASLIYAIITYNKFKSKETRESVHKKVIITSEIEPCEDSNIPPPYSAPIKNKLNPEKIAKLEEMCRNKLSKYTENYLSLTELESKESLFEVDLNSVRKISCDTWFKSIDSPKKESPLTSDTEDEWCILDGD